MLRNGLKRDGSWAVGSAVQTAVGINMAALDSEYTPPRLGDVSRRLVPFDWLLVSARMTVDLAPRLDSRSKGMFQDSLQTRKSVASMEGCCTEIQT